MSALSVDFFTSFCIEIEPSEQVVWLWKSPATYVPGVFAARAPPEAAAIAAALIASSAIRFLLNGG